MARLRADEPDRPTPLDIIRCRRALRLNDAEALCTLALAYYVVGWGNVGEFFGRFDPECAELDKERRRLHGPGAAPAD